MWNKRFFFWEAIVCMSVCARLNSADNMETESLIAECGGYCYENNVIYVGTWNNSGYRQGFGHLLFPDGTRYDGFFEGGLFYGLGVLTFSDGAKYEGEFLDGWYHGYGIFWRADGMRYEGQFQGGKIWGLGLTTFNDESNGFPRYEGFFQNCKLLKKTNCSEVVQKAQKIAFMARNQLNYILNKN